jgi:hypothetical protein
MLGGPGVNAGAGSHPRQLRHRHFGAAAGFRDHAQRRRIEFDAGQAQFVHDGVDLRAVAVLPKIGERGADLGPRVAQWMSKNYNDVSAQIACDAT